MFHQKGALLRFQSAFELQLWGFSVLGAGSFLQTFHSSTTEFSISLYRNNNVIFLKSPCYYLPHSVCSTQPAWSLNCHLPVVLMLIICTTRHVEIQSLSH